MAAGWALIVTIITGTCGFLYVPFKRQVYTEKITLKGEGSMIRCKNPPKFNLKLVNMAVMSPQKSTNGPIKMTIFLWETHFL